MSESSKRHSKFLSLIFILKCLSKASVIRTLEKHRKYRQSYCQCTFEYLVHLQSETADENNFVGPLYKACAKIVMLFEVTSRVFLNENRSYIENGLPRWIGFS